ncbi:Endospore coat-associated protein YheD [compost metagenome]
MLKQYRGLYLKPESGKAGKGIMLLQWEETSPRPYCLIIQGQHHKNIIYRTASLPKLWRRIRKETGTCAYIMQEAIELSTYRNRHFDLRVLVQKTGRGNFMITGIGARVAGLKRITTHVPQGGSIEEPEKLLLSSFGQEMTALLMNKLKSSAILIAKQLEKSCGYMLGEMSMDLGIDRNGKLWFFEANAKPMKFDEPHIRKKSLERVIQYSQYLYRNPKNLQS